MMRKKIILILFVLFILALPLLLRLLGQNYTLPGEEIYSYLLHKKVADESLPIVGSILSSIPHILLLFLPLVIVLFSFWLIFFILRELKVKKEFFFVFLIVLTLSPLAQSLAFFAGINAVVFPLFLLGLLFLLKGRLILGSMPLIFTSFLSPLHALVNIFVILCVKKYWFKDKRLNLVAVLIGMIFLAVHSHILFNLSKIYIEKNFLNFFSEFGSHFGFGIFEIFLAGFGFFNLLRYRKAYSFIIYLFTGILVFSFFLSGLRIYSLLIISFLNTLVICEIFRRKWHVKALKNLVLLTIFCGLLFTSISHAMTLSQADPSLNFVQGFVVLSQKKPGKVLTMQDYNNFVEFYSNKLPVVRGTEVSSGLFSDYLNMFYSSDLSETLKLMKKHSVRYIIITPEMKDGKVWKKDNEGLVFIVKHSKHFKNLIENEDIAIWEVYYEA